MEKNLPGFINQADKNSNVIALDRIIIVLLQLYHSTFKTLGYLIPEAYLKLCQIYKMMTHIENLDIVRTLYSGILYRYIQNTV